MKRVLESRSLSEQQAASHAPPRNRVIASELFDLLERRKNSRSADELKSLAEQHNVDVEVLEALEGVCLRHRWRNYDGERHWRWKNRDGTPCAWSRTTWGVQRMVWVRRGGRWHGEWIWEAYDRDEEWEGSRRPRVNRRWLNMGNVHQSATVPSRSVDVPMEVLRYMLKEFDWVCAAISFLYH